MFPCLLKHFCKSLPQTHSDSLRFHCLCSGSLFVPRLFMFVLSDNALFVPTMFGSHIALLVYSLPSPGKGSSDLLSLDLLCQRDPSANHLVESPLQKHKNT